MNTMGREKAASYQGQRTVRICADDSYPEWAREADITGRPNEHTAITESLVETRKKQCETIRHLYEMRAGLRGIPAPEEGIEEWNGLVELTEQVADANKAIANLVNECRELIGI